ncbi:hypothetical protein C4544_03115 [candidate division WS5 bacterium]|uniref:Glycerophosphoryl diester phosphodiesterase membrane domain-containing protein n=1 Tax=candidate division WS5 bacterium TaxID=2093353 RepID=A0A419DEA4_9BACT|nr:MAG: hypothetical protein C4544_03115 [candidate division WS5 bacterium]
MVVSNQKTGSQNQKEPDYLGNMKNAFNIVRKNRFLWILGALAGGGFANFNFGGGDFNSFVSQDKNGDTSISFSEKQSLDANQLWQSISGWVQANWIFVAAVASVLVILMIFFIILSVMARAGQVHAVSEISQGKESSFGKALKFGWHKFWRVLGTSILIGFIMLILFIVLALPAVLLWPFLPLFIAYIILAILLVIPVAIAMGIVYEYALRYIALKDEKAIQSLKSAYELMKGRAKETVLIWLVTVGAAIVSGLVLVIAVVFLLIILVLLGLLLFILSPIAGIIYAVVASVIFLIGLFLAGGFIGSLISAYWTLSFKEITS